MLLYKLTKKFMEVQVYILNPFGIIFFNMHFKCSLHSETLIVNYYVIIKNL
jgi:hypothetical protein